MAKKKRPSDAPKQVQQEIKRTQIAKRAPKGRETR